MCRKGTIMKRILDLISRLETEIEILNSVLNKPLDTGVKENLLTERELIQHKLLELYKLAGGEL